MRRLLMLTLGAVLLGAGLVRAAPVKSLADLFPANTIAYAEIRQPGALAKEIRGLFQNSVLGNVPESLARFQEKYDPKGASYRIREKLGAFGLMLSPEVAAEIGRLKGAAIGLTGMGNDGGPKFLAVFLPGSSNAPPFLLRAALTMGPCRAADKVEGVKTYRMDHYIYKSTGVVRQPGPALAMMPGVLLIGSPEEVAGAIRRAKGKAEGKSLAGAPLFQEALKEAGNEPGLFAYGDVPPLFEVVEKLVQNDRHGREAMALIKLINPRAFRAVIYTVTLNQGTLRFRKATLLNPKEKSPLVELLPATPVSPEILHYVPEDALLVAALSNGDGAKRWPKFLALADQLAQLDGHPKKLPSEMVKQLEERLKIDLGKDVVGKIANLALAVGDPLKAPIRRVTETGPNFRSSYSSPQVPIVVVVQTTDEAAAKKIVEEVLPRVFAMMSRGEKAEPTSREVNGQKIYTLKMGRNEGLHYGRHGSFIVFGPYADPVVKALAGGAAGKGWVADPKHAALLKEPANPVAFAAVMTGKLLGGMFFSFRMAMSQAREGAKAEVEPRRATGPKPKAPEKKEPTVKVEIIPPDKQTQELSREIERIVGKEEPLILSVTRPEGRVASELRMSGLKPLVARVTDFVVEQLYKSEAMRKERGKPTTGPTRIEKK